MKNLIMVIDDDKEFLEEVKETLMLSEYDVVTLDDEGMALEKIAEMRPDVILLDMHMPKESGFQVACRIKSTASLKHIPIIAITGYLTERYKQVIKEYSILRYLTKPLDPLELVLSIERAL